MSAQVGQQLRQAREAKQVSQAQAARDTLIRIHYLQALEAGDFQAMPSAAQARGFLRAYADYLGLDVDSLLGVLDSSGQEAAPVAEVEHSPSPVPASASQAD